MRLANPPQAAPPRDVLHVGRYGDVRKPYYDRSISPPARGSRKNGIASPELLPNENDAANRSNEEEQRRQQK